MIQPEPGVVHYVAVNKTGMRFGVRLGPRGKVASFHADVDTDLEVGDNVIVQVTKVEAPAELQTELE